MRKNSSARAYKGGARAAAKALSPPFRLSAMLFDAREESFAVALALSFADTLDVQEVVERFGQYLAHVAQCCIGEDDVGRHAVACG